MSEGSDAVNMNRTLLFLCVICLTSTTAIKLTSDFKRCKVSPKTDNKPNECLKDAIQEAIDHLAHNGNKELGLVDLDPLSIKEVLIDQGGDSPVAIKLRFTNNTLSGLATTKVTSVQGKLSSPKDFQMIIKNVVETTYLVGPYKINGKILVLPIVGDGISNMTLVNLSGDFVLNGQPQTRNGKVYLNITSSHLNINIKRMYLSLTHLFNDNKTLGDNMNRFLNEHWDEIFKELQVSIQNAFSKVFEWYAKRLLERVQFKNLFLFD